MDSDSINRNRARLNLYELLKIAWLAQLGGDRSSRRYRIGRNRWRWRIYLIPLTAINARPAISPRQNEKNLQITRPGHLFSDDLFSEHPYRSLLISFICVNRHVKRRQLINRMNLSTDLLFDGFARVNTEHM